MLARVGLVACAAWLAASCASLEGLRGLVQPPRFEQARDQPAEVTLEAPSALRPLGGAAVRLWTAVTNPNAFGLTLGTLDGTLYLEGERAAAAAFPLGLPLAAGQQTVVPIDLSISFADIPGLADVIRRAARQEPVGFRLAGTIGVDAGRLGQPVFGPMTLMTGEIGGGRGSNSQGPTLQLPIERPRANCQGPTAKGQLQGPTAKDQLPLGRYPLGSWPLEVGSWVLSEADRRQNLIRAASWKRRGSK